MRRLILALLLVPACALAQSGVWGLRGITKRLIVRGNRVYAVDGRGVAAYDATTFAKIAAAETEAESFDGAFAGDTLVVVTREGIERFTAGLQRVGIQATPPATRVASNGEIVATAGADGVRVWRGTALVGLWPQSAHRITALAFRGDALFVAADTIGVQVLDGATAEPIGTVGEGAIDLAVDGDFLYAASGYGGLAIYDVRDPLAAALISRTAPTEGFYTRVAAGGGRAAVSEDTRRVRVFDVGSPAAPRAFAPFAQTSEAMVMSGATLFVSGSNIDPDFAIEVATGIPVRAYDLAQPDAPRVAGEAHDLAGPVNGAATDGTYAFVADPPYFRVIDVSKTSAPVEVASLRIDDIQPYVKSLGSRVILYGNGNVQYIDVSDPRRPRLAGTFESLGRPPSAAAISRNAFIEGNTWSGFHVFDFPAGAPRFIAGIKTHPVDIVAYGDAAYYIVEWQTVGIADLSEGARPVKAILIPAIQLAQIDNLLLIRDTKSIHVFSLADPLDPVEIAAISIDRGGVLGAGSGDAWIGAPGSLVRLDLTNPAVPSFQTTGMRVMAPSQVAASGEKVVVADRYGLRVFGPDSAPPPPPPPPAAPGKRRAVRSH